MTKSVIQALLHRPIAYHATVAKAFGSVKLAILWGQLFYWSDKTNDPEGWVYKTQADWFEETGLSRKEQETARTLGKQLGVLEEQLRGMPATMHFRIRFEKAVSIMEEYVQKKVNHTLFPESPSDGFDAFWEAFPKKTAKAEARKAWNKLNPSDALEKLIIQNVSERAKLDAQWKRGYCMNGATYLNQGRWEDQYEKIKAHEDADPDKFKSVKVMR